MVDNTERTEQRFRYLWRVLLKAYAKEPNAFLCGCGRDSLYYLVRRVVGDISVTASDLRWALKRAAWRGYTGMTVVPGRCTQYSMKRVSPSPKQIMAASVKKADLALADLTAHGGVLSEARLTAFKAALFRSTTRAVQSKLDNPGTTLGGSLGLSCGHTIHCHGAIYVRAYVGANIPADLCRECKDKIIG